MIVLEYTANKCRKKVLLQQVVNGLLSTLKILFFV